jgi:hypothetical protein
VLTIQPSVDAGQVRHNAFKRRARDSLGLRTRRRRAMTG